MKPINWEPMEDYIFGKHKLNGKILNIGCGAFLNPKIMIEENNKGPELSFVHIDIDKEAIEILSKDYPKEDIRVMDAVKLGFSNNYFDNVIGMYNIYDEVYPLNKRKKAFKEAFRVLKPDGLFIISSHNFLWKLIHPIKILKLGLYNNFRMCGDYCKGRKYNNYYQGSTSKTIKQVEEAGFVFVERFPKSVFARCPTMVFRK